MLSCLLYEFIPLQFLCHRLMLFVSYTHTDTHSRTRSCFSLALSKPASSLEAGARRQLVGGPVLEAGGGLGQRFSGQSSDTSAHGFVYSHKTWLIFNQVQSLHRRTSYTVHFKDWENCPFVSSRFPSWFLSSLLLLPFSSSPLSSFFQFWGTQVVLGLGLRVSQGLRWQASAGQDAT